LTDYEHQFRAILDGTYRNPPYDSETYVNYVKLNQSRIARWNKKIEMDTELLNEVQKINEAQKWLLITEPWCADAAHSHTVMVNLVKSNPNIELEVMNRDTPDSEIENYLTDGARSIPILVVRDTNGTDLFSWGPRPREAQLMVMQHKTDKTRSSEQKQKELQAWYNNDRSRSIQVELLELFKSIDCNMTVDAHPVSRSSELTKRHITDAGISMNESQLDTKITSS